MNINIMMRVGLAVVVALLALNGSITNVVEGFGFTNYTDVVTAIVVAIGIMPLLENMFD